MKLGSSMPPLAQFTRVPSFVERTQDPNNRRRLALRLTESGRAQLESGASTGTVLLGKLERLAHSELRAVERAIEILERGF